MALANHWLKLIFFLFPSHFGKAVIQRIECQPLIEELKGALKKQFRVAQISSTESKDIKCHTRISFVLIRELHVVFLGKKLAFCSKLRHFWYQNFQCKTSFLML